MSSQFDHTAPTPPHRMQQVMLAALPGFAVLCALYGLGPLMNLLWAALGALGTEALVLQLRQRPLWPSLSDGSALLSALLLALALPATAPGWLALIAAAFAILFGKQLYGGLGHNPFNPAMLGYVAVLAAFPLEMTQWPAPATADAWTQATALEALKHNHGLTQEELLHTAAFGLLGAQGSEWTALAFLGGGLWLLKRRLIRWQAPCGLLAAVLLMSLLFWNGSGSDSHGSPWVHLLSGGTLLGAFFIVTDPVTSPSTARGQLYFGLGVGVLTYLIRAFGSYPDGVAFAVLLMNLCTPLIELYTRPQAVLRPQEPDL